MTTDKMKPIHPGKILKDELKELGLSANEFAKELAVPVNRITSILNGDRAVTADTAIRLSCFFGTYAEFWLNLQTAYNLKIAMQKSAQKSRNKFILIKKLHKILG